MKVINKFDHLKIKLIQKKYKYILFQDKNSCKIQFDKILSINDPFIYFQGNNEYSLICPSEIQFDSNTIHKEENEWIAFHIIGEMPFGSVEGLLAYISDILIKENIGLCVASSFLTDYFFIKSENKERVFNALNKVGWNFL